LVCRHHWTQLDALLAPPASTPTLLHSCAANTELERLERELPKVPRQPPNLAVGVPQAISPNRSKSSSPVSHSLFHLSLHTVSFVTQCRQAKHTVSFVAQCRRAKHTVSFVAQCRRAKQASMCISELQACCDSQHSMFFKQCSKFHVCAVS